MSREIKFRAWNKDTQCMFHWNLSLGFSGTDKVWSPVMQYTGLKDKHGTEIYEGDRVRFFLSNGDSHEGHVVFIDGCVEIYFKIALKIEGIFRLRDYLKCYTANHAVEIIGNIYENPQLLQE